MKFKKISDNAIRCTITADEMSSYDIQLDDLLEDRKKAETFLRYVLEEAREEVNFTASEEALSVQLSVMPGGDVSMMISGGQEESLHDVIDQLKDTLSELGLNPDAGDGQKETESGEGLSLTQSAQELENRPEQKNEGVSHGKDAARAPAVASAEIDISQRPPTASDMVMARMGEEIARQSVGRKNLLAQLDKPLWAEFSSFEHLLGMLTHTELPREIPSELYRRDQIYYLRLFFADQVDVVAKCALSISEYADFMYAEEEGFLTFREHADLILDRDAVAALYRLTE